LIGQSIWLQRATLAAWRQRSRWSTLLNSVHRRQLICEGPHAHTEIEGGTLLLAPGDVRWVPRSLRPDLKAGAYAGDVQVSGQVPFQEPVSDPGTEYPAEDGCLICVIAGS
jgi:hypothetical protein